MAFKEITPESLQWNPFTQIGKGWFLVTAGDATASNTMTVSWGGLGIWWGKNAVTIYIRKNRYTKEFIDKDGLFTLSALPESYRKALGYMGSHSGREGDKWEPAGLTPLPIDGSAAVGEASVILVCRTLLKTELTPDTFLDPEAENRWYPGDEKGNWHTLYIGEIVKAYEKE